MESMNTEKWEKCELQWCLYEGIEINDKEKVDRFQEITIVFL